MTDATGKKYVLSVPKADLRKQWVAKLQAAAKKCAENHATDFFQEADLVAMEGYVEKKGQINTQFQHRFCVLSDGSLKYFRDKTGYFKDRAVYHPRPIKMKLPVHTITGGGGGGGD